MSSGACTPAGRSLARTPARRRGTVRDRGEDGMGNWVGTRLGSEWALHSAIVSGAAEQGNGVWLDPAKWECKIDISR